jgi:hypothetical protein
MPLLIGGKHVEIAYIIYMTRNQGQNIEPESQEFFIINKDSIWGKSFNSGQTRFTWISAKLQALRSNPWKPMQIQKGLAIKQEIYRFINIYRCRIAEMGRLKFCSGKTIIFVQGDLVFARQE